MLFQILEVISCFDHCSVLFPIIPTDAVPGPILHNLIIAQIVPAGAVPDPSGDFPADNLQRFRLQRMSQHLAQSSKEKPQ